MSTAYIDIDQHLYYKTEGAITASMLAESLLGLDGIAKRAAEFLSAYLKVEIRDAEVLISSVTFGSIEEEWLFRIVFGKGKAGQKKFEEFREALGLKRMNINTIISLSVAAALSYGIYCYATSSGDEKATIHIENSFNNWGKELSLSKDELLKLLETSIRNKDELKKSVVRLAHPDGHEKGGEIILNRSESTTLPEEVISVVPNEYTRDKVEEPFKDFDNSDLSIRAIDLDRPSSGWWAIAPNVSEKRLQLFVAEDIDPMTIPYGRTVKADITVTYKVDNHGNKSPKKLQLRKIHQD